MSGSTTLVQRGADPFTRSHTHQLISRGLDDDYTPPSITQSLEYHHNDTNLIYPPIRGTTQGGSIYSNNHYKAGIYDDVPDHGGKRHMTGRSHRLTQSYSATAGTRPHPSSSTSYSYHPPTTSLTYNHTPLHRNHSAGYHSDEDRMQSFHGDDRHRHSYHSNERVRCIGHSNHGRLHGYHGDDKGQHGYHREDRGQHGYHGDDRLSYHRNERSYYGNERSQLSYYGNNERSQPSYHSNERLSKPIYYSNGDDHHSNNDRHSNGDRHSNLTSSVIYTRPLPSTSWHSNSWSSYNNKVAINSSPSPLIGNSSSPFITSPLVTTSTTTNSLSSSLIINSPDSSPPTTHTRPLNVGAPPTSTRPSNMPYMEDMVTPPTSTHPYNNAGVVPYIEDKVNTHDIPYIDIISHPEDMGVAPNTRLILKCEARLLHSIIPPVYQWYKDEEPLVGEIESVLNKHIVTEEDTGFYFCIVSDVDLITQRKSRQAYVYLEDDEEEYTSFTEPSPPAIIEQPPPNISVLTGTRLHLKLLVQGVPEPIFRWFRNDIELAQFTSCELLIPCVTVKDEGRYVCLIKNDNGSILSRVINVKLLSKTHRSSSDSQLESFHSFDDENIAFPPSYTAPSSPQKLPSSLSFKPHPPTSLFSPETTPMTPPSVEIDDNMLSMVASQLKRQVDCFRMCQLALCLGVATYDLSVIKMKYNTIDEQICQVLTSWKDHTHHPTIGMLEDLLSMEGFMISLPHHIGAMPTIGTPPIITQHPRNPHIATDTVTLSVKAEGAAPLNYQWYRNNTILTNETSFTLQLYHSIESGLYHCIVSNCYGKAVSHPAFIGVTCSKFKLPHNTTSKKGGAHSGNFIQQNEKSSYDPSSPLLTSLGIPRKGSGDTLSLPSLDSMTGNNVAVVGGERTGEGLMERFDQLKIDKGDKPVILKHPTSQEIASGDPLHLSVIVTTPESLKYIWYFNGLALCKETFPEFYLNCFTEEDIGDYYCEVSNNYDTVKTDIAKISLKNNY